MCRERVAPLLRALCSGVHDDDELNAALDGLLCASAFVRAAALTALPSVPTLAEGLPPRHPDSIAVMFIACNDVSTSNADAAFQLWQKAHCKLQGGHVGCIISHLSSPHKEVRRASAIALSMGLQMHPSAVAGAMQVRGTGMYACYVHYGQALL